MLTEAENYIFDLAQNPMHSGKLKDSSQTLEGANFSCGDEITLNLKIEKGVIVQAKHDTRACAVCIAGAEILIEEILNKTTKEALKTSSQTILKKIPIELSVTRQKCATLALQTLKQLKQAKI